MKTLRQWATALTAIVTVCLTSSFKSADYDTVKVAAPFNMPAITIYDFRTTTSTTPTTVPRRKVRTLTQPAWLPTPRPSVAPWKPAIRLAADGWSCQPVNGRQDLSTSEAAATCISPTEPR